MAQERLILQTAAGELVIPRTDFLSLEVELDNELASLFKLRLAHSAAAEWRLDVHRR